MPWKSRHDHPQWRHDYLAPGKAGDEPAPETGITGLALGAVAILCWMVVLVIEWLVFYRGLTGGHSLPIGVVEALIAVPLINIAAQLATMFLFADRAGTSVVVPVASVLLLVPWIAICFPWVAQVSELLPL